MTALTRLAALTKATLTDGLVLVYADALEDLPAAALGNAFERAEKQCRFLPTPAELRDLVGMSVARIEQLEADKAWLWLMDYLEKHGAEGRSWREPRRSGCQKCDDTGFVLIRKEQHTYTINCECRGKAVRAPEIPPRIQHGLRQMANTVISALHLIAEAEPVWQGKIRQEFTAAFVRSGAPELRKERATR